MSLRVWMVIVVDVGRRGGRASCRALFVGSRGRKDEVADTQHYDVQCGRVPDGREELSAADCGRGDGAKGTRVLVLVYHTDARPSRLVGHPLCRLRRTSSPPGATTPSPLLSSTTAYNTLECGNYHLPHTCMRHPNTGQTIPKIHPSIHPFDALSLPLAPPSLPLPPPPHTLPFTPPYSQCLQLGFDGMPEEMPENAEDDEEFLRKLHTLLMELDVVKGSLSCPNCSREYPIDKTIVSMVLREDEV